MPLQATHHAGARSGLLLALLAAFGFSMKAIFVKLAYAYPIDAITLLALRMTFALPVFAWVAWQSGKDAPPLTSRDVWALIFLGMMGYYGSSILDFWGLLYISAALERLILYTYPTLTFLIAMFFYRRVPTGREIVAILLSYLGIGLAFTHDLQTAGDNGAIWLGVLLVFAASLTYAIYLIGSGSLIARLGSRRFTALCMLVSTGGTLLHFCVAHPPPEMPTALSLPWQAYALAAAIALFSTILPVFMLSAAIARIGAPRVALAGSIGPFATIFFGWLWLNEILSVHQMTGAFLVLLGVLMIGLPERKR